MSRKYLNDKYCVRCGRNTPCPYLRNNCDILDKNKVVLDIGCGNGRNSEFAKEKGCKVISLDMANDYGIECILGHEKLPLKNKSIDIILCNYLMMFLNPVERMQLIREIDRVAKTSCVIMLELYPAKDSWAKNEKEMLALQSYIFRHLGWDKIKYSKGCFIAVKV